MGLNHLARSLGLWLFDKYSPFLLYILKGGAGRVSVN